MAASGPPKKGPLFNETTPDDVIHEIGSDLERAELARLTRSSQALRAVLKHDLEKRRLPLLCQLASTYKLTDNMILARKTQESKEVKGEVKLEISGQAISNPLLLTMNQLLSQKPTEALDLANSTLFHPLLPKKKLSLFQYAYWTGNFMLCQLILQKLNPEQKKQADEQRQELENLTRSYNLELRPSLSAEQKLEEAVFGEQPLLLKQTANNQEKLYFWGNRNGEWKLQELSNKDQVLFAHLKFPSEKAETLGQDKITPEMYQALAKYHTLGQYDLREYVDGVDAFLQRYPANQDIPQNQEDACKVSGNQQIGGAQTHFPGWIAQFWCSMLSFPPLSTPLGEREAYIKKIVGQAEAVALKDLDNRDFFTDSLGKEFSILMCIDDRPELPYVPETAQWRDGARQDGLAMSAIGELMTKEFGIINQLLATAQVQAAVEPKEAGQAPVPLARGGGKS